MDRAFSILGSVFMKLTMRAAAKKVTLITTAFVLAVSTLTAAVPFVLSKNAGAVSAITVTPDSNQGWAGIDDNGQGGSLSFVNGPVTAPLGSGSAQLSVSTSSQGYLLAKSAYGGLKLSDLTTLSYDAYIQQGNNTIVPSLQFNIVANASTDTSWQGRLVYEPYQSSTVTDGVWQSHNALAGKWWFSKPASFGGSCPQSSPCTIDQIVELYPNAGVSQGQPLVAFKAGSGWNTPFVGNIDNFKINSDVYNFEPITFSTPTNLQPLDGSAVNDPNFSMSWNAVAGATVYEYRTSNSLVDATTLGPIAYTDSSASASNYTLGAQTITRGNNGTPEGNWYWQVRAGNGSGVWSAWSAINLVTTDYTGPAIVFTQPTSLNLGNRNSVLVEATTDDAVSYEVWLNGSPVQSGDTPFTGYVVNTAAGGSYTVQVKAYDQLGNVGSNQITFTVDNDGPNLVTSLVDGTTVGESLTIESEVGDGDADTFGLAIYSVDDLTTPLLSSGSLAYTFNTRSLANGDYVAILSAQDSFGNESTRLIDFTVFNAPVVVVTQDPNAAPGSDDGDDTNTNLPSAVGPAGNVAAVLGLDSTNTGDDTTQGTEGVEGTSTEKNLAAAVDTDSTDGTVLGMAWYWWLLILAALATLIWWIIASIRNRAAQN